MKAHGIFLSVASVLALVVVWTQTSTVHAAVKPDQKVASLERRVEALERLLKNQPQSQSETLLKARVTELERLMRENRGGTLTMAPKADLNDLARLLRENATLKRSVTSLEMKVDNLRRDGSRNMNSTSLNSGNSLQREIDSLRRSIASVERMVQRIESRR
ncbi:MAG: hypothetical protein ACPGVU_22925 [Limisphaerales bacterium]